jgi:hypothetical protein
MSALSKDYFSIKETIKKDVRLIAVSKTKPASSISDLYELGQYDFGENKVQELVDKSIQLKTFSNINWHFIGHLQSNKINQLLAVKNLKYIHSIDRMKLLDKLLAKKPSTENSEKIGLFIQVNTSGEDEKGGFTDIAQIKEAIIKINEHESFSFIGLMTIGTIRTENFESEARACFLKLNKFKEQLQEDLDVPIELSMGMSSDYLIAQKMGSKWLRIGSKIFGNRS